MIHDLLPHQHLLRPSIMLNDNVDSVSVNNNSNSVVVNNNSNSVVVNNDNAESVVGERRDVVDRSTNPVQEIS